MVTNTKAPKAWAVAAQKSLRKYGKMGALRVDEEVT